MKRWGLIVCLCLALINTGLLGAGEDATPLSAPTANAALDATAEVQKSFMEYGLMAIAVGAIVIAGALATGMVQKSIGPAVAAACAEDRKYFVIAIILLALPETILILAVGMAYLLMQKIK